ncbi:MAG: DUF167 domain-containing protein [Casimicrobiaceae bacterium]
MTAAAGWYREIVTAGGLRLLLTLHVQPGAKATEAAGVHGDALKVRLAAPPVEGKANAALVRFIAAAFGVPMRQVEIVQGGSSRRKVVAVQSPLRRPAWIDAPAAT